MLYMLVHMMKASDGGKTTVRCGAKIPDKKTSEPPHPNVTSWESMVTCPDCSLEKK